MKRVRVRPSFYRQLAEACTIDQEVEIVGRRLDEIERRFAEGWDSGAPDDPKPVPGRGADWRFLVILLDDGPLAVAYAQRRAVDTSWIDIASLAVMPPPGC